MRQRGSEFDPVIAELVRNALQHFGCERVEIEPVRRIEGPYSSVLNVRISAPHSESRAYIKVFKPRERSAADLARVDRFLHREFRATTALHEAFSGQNELGALRPIACLPQYRALVTAEVDGRPFGDLLTGARTVTPYLRDVARRVGRWVDAYQRLSGPQGDVEIAERRAYIDERLRFLEGRILTGAERDRALATVDGLATRIGAPSVPAVAIHADLTPTNVLVSEEGRVTVLDFTMAKAGTRFHDLAHMYFHLALFADRRRRRAPLARALQDAMLQGFDASASADDPLFRLMVWQHAVCHVAMLAERQVPLVAAAYRWYLRRRWKRVTYLANSITRTAE